MTSKRSYDNLRLAREARWSDPAQRQALAERNRKRARHAHTPTDAQKFTIVPAPKQAETVHTPDLVFPSGLRLGLMRTEELLAARNDREVRLRQSERLAGPLKRVANAEENQLKADLLSFELELKRRALADCQRQREQKVEHEEEFSHA